MKTIMSVLLSLMLPAQVWAETAPLCPPVEEMIADMGVNDVIPRGVNPTYGWSRRGYAQTSIATYERQPQWWRELNPPYEGTWGRLMPWFVIFEGEDAASKAVEVQVGRMAVYALSRKDRTWRLLDADAPWAVSMCPPESNFVDCDMGEPHTGFEGLPTFWNGEKHGYGHGWFQMLTLDDPYDIQSLSITMQIRKVGPEADKASVLAHVGADFYPNEGRPEGANPGAGLSKVKRIGSDWTTVTMTVVSDQTGNDTGISFADLRQNPPCLTGAE